MPKTNACYLHLANGWTISVSPDDTPPALCSVAAFPTAKEGGKLQPEDWFKFDDRGLLDRRCWSLGEVREAMVIVDRAAPPVA